MENMPQSIGAPRTTQNLQSFNLINFMYLPTWQDLLKHCYSVHLQQDSVPVIIVQDLENYCFSGKVESHDHTSLICASLLHAASVTAIKNSKTVYLISGYNSKNCSLPRTMSKNFFHNIWRLTVEAEKSNAVMQKVIKLRNLSQDKVRDMRLFVFYENKEKEFLDLVSAYEAINQLVKEGR